MKTLNLEHSKTLKAAADNAGVEFDTELTWLDGLAKPDLNELLDLAGTLWKTRKVKTLRVMDMRDEMENIWVEGDRKTRLAESIIDVLEERAE